MKNILHHGIVLHPKAQGKQHRWRCMGKGAILSCVWLSPPAPKGAKKGRLFRGVPFNK